MSCDNICHGGKQSDVRLEKVGAEGLADAEQLLCVNGGLVVDALQGARADADAVGKPLVIMALPPQFLADKMSYMYLHGVAICAICYRLLGYYPTTTDKKKASNLVP